MANAFKHLWIKEDRLCCATGLLIKTWNSASSACVLVVPLPQTLRRDTP